MPLRSRSPHSQRNDRRTPATGLTGSIRDTVAALARLERTDRLLALKHVKIRVVAPGQARDLLTTLTVAGYLLPRT